MTVGKILGINMVISTVRNVEPNGENIMISYVLIQYDTKQFPCW
jgi:hypothetical protein